MINKNDCLLLLTEMQDRGEDVRDQITLLMSSPTIPTSVVKYLTEHRQFDVAEFYEKLRWNYNHKKSTLYKNLVREEFNQADDVLTTLAALSLQILLNAKKLDNNRMFLKHSRLEEITSVLNAYAKNYDLVPCLKLLYLIKSDLVLFETVTGHRK